MSLLLYEHHTLITKLNFEECILRLEKTIGQQGCIKEYMYGTTPYFGKIFGTLFTASRIKTGSFFRGGFLYSDTYVSGRILSGENGCKIDFEISQNGTGKIPAILISAVAGLLQLVCVVFFILGSITASDAEKIMGFFGVVLIAVLYMVAWVPYKIEAITCRNDFYELFGVEVEI